MTSKMLRACEHLVTVSESPAAEHFATADTNGNDRGTVWGVIGGAWAAVGRRSVLLVALVGRHGGVSLLLLLLLLLRVRGRGGVHRSDGRRWQTVRRSGRGNLVRGVGRVRRGSAGVGSTRTSRVESLRGRRVRRLLGAVSRGRTAVVALVRAIFSGGIGHGRLEVSISVRGQALWCRSSERHEWTPGGWLSAGGGLRGGLKPVPVLGALPFVALASSEDDLCSLKRRKRTPDAC